MSNFFVPTRFTWRFGGSVVHLCGSFTRWVETVPMQPVEGHPDVFTVIVHLPPGYHQYKFIVDGEWRHDGTQPYMPDPLGNVNNWLFVRRLDHTEQQRHHMQGIPIPQRSSSHLQPHESSQQHLQAPAVDHMQASTPPDEAKRPLQHTASQDQSMDASGVGGGGSDVDMATADSPAGGPSASFSPRSEEPQYTRRRISEFLTQHTCYELIPESGKVVLLDTELPVRQAFHALHEQGVPSAPLWDSHRVSVIGMISASDFIHVLQRLRSSVSSGATPMSEAEMDSLTIKEMREHGASDGRAPKKLVSVNPSHTLQEVSQQLFQNRCSMAPVLTRDVCVSNSSRKEGEEEEDEAGESNTLLHIATISGILATLMRHFRASLSSLPLLGVEVGALPIGTWSPDAQLPQLDQRFSQDQAGQERKDRRKLRQLSYVQPGTPLTQALQLLLDAAISTLPVVDEDGRLLDMYARSDITMLARGNSYSRLQWEDVTVGQALSLAQLSQAPQHSPHHSPLGSTNNLRNAHAQRVHTCTQRDTLRSVVERLSVPGVRRLFAIHPETRKVQGIVSLSDVAAFLFAAT